MGRRISAFRVNFMRFNAFVAVFLRAQILL